MYFQGKFKDLDEMIDALVGWDLDFLPLEKGRFPSEIRQILLENTFIGEASFFRKVEQRGATPTGYRTFVVPIDDQVNYHWRGRQISGDNLSLFPPGGELYSVSNSSFGVYTISFSIPLLEESLSLVKSTKVDDHLKQEHVWQVGQKQLRAIRKLIRQLLYSPIYEPLYPTQEKELELAVRILSSMDTKSTQPIQQNSRRAEALKKCVDLISSFPQRGSLKIKDLCLETNVSERTLQYAFFERYGLTPKEYIQNYNLRMVRRALKNKTRGIKIYSIAAQYGFWHMGQFASDYKNHFGELPSQTF